MNKNKLILEKLKLIPPISGTIARLIVDRNINNSSNIVLSKKNILENIYKDRGTVIKIVYTDKTKIEDQNIKEGDFILFNPNFTDDKLMYRNENDKEEGCYSILEYETIIALITK